MCLLVQSLLIEVCQEAKTGPNPGYRMCTRIDGLDIEETMLTLGQETKDQFDLD